MPHDIATPVTRNVDLGHGNFLLEFDAPEAIREMDPAQFFMIRIPGSEVLLRRPFSVCGLPGTFDDAADEGWCVHVQYSDLMRDPLATMRRIYTHFGEAPSGLHERRIEAWLREKPQTAHGRHVYDPADFGWSYAELAGEWRDYVDRYRIERER